MIWPPLCALRDPRCTHETNLLANIFLLCFSPIRSYQTNFHLGGELRHTCMCGCFRNGLLSYQRNELKMSIIRGRFLLLRGPPVQVTGTWRLKTGRRQQCKGLHWSTFHSGIGSSSIMDAGTRAWLWPSDRTSRPEESRARERRARLVWLGDCFFTTN